MKKVLLITTLIAHTFIYAQNVGINATGASPNASAILDVSSPNKGLLVPRVALIDILDVATITSPATSLLVYNTATSGISPNNVTPGYYYFDGTQWVRFNSGASNFWSLTGNAGTTAGTNFLGTTDAQDLVFKTNGTEGWRIKNSANRELQANSSHMRITKTFGNGGIKIGAALGNAQDNYFIGDSIAASGGGRSSSIGIGYRLGLYSGGGHSNMIMIGRNIFNNASNGSGIDHATLIGADAASLGGDGVIIGGFAAQNGFSNGVIIGKNAGRTGGNNGTFVGEDAGRNSLNTNNNTFLGYRSGYTNVSGGNNTMIGYLADATVAGLTNASAIGYNAKVSISNAMVLGDNNTKVGIGTSSPISNLEVFSTGDAELTVSSTSNFNYCGGVLVLKANSSDGNRALGTFMHDDFNDIEWYIGRPYKNNNDNFVINRTTSTTIHDRSTSAMLSGPSNTLFFIEGTTGNVGIGTGTAIPNSTLQVNGSYSAAVKTTNASYTLTGTDQVLIHRGGGATFTLPAAGTCTGRIYQIVNLGTGVITFSTSIQVANGVNYNTLCSGACFGDVGSTGGYLGNTVSIVSDGTNWVKIGL